MPAHSFAIRSVAVVVHEGKVLLVSSKASPGSWVPPGGKVDPGERAAEAATRETLEEAGIEVVVGPLVAFREVWWDGRDGLELFFAARPAVGWEETAPTPEAGRAADWFDALSLSGLRHYPAELSALCQLATSGRATCLYLGPVDRRQSAG